jgi:hypothetical protein
MATRTSKDARPVSRLCYPKALERKGAPVSVNQMHRILNRLSGGEAELYRKLCEVAFEAALGPQVLRRLDSLVGSPSPEDLKKLMGCSVLETVNRLTEVCDKIQFADQPQDDSAPKRVKIIKQT